MRIEWYLITLMVLGGLGNLWIIRDCKRINADPNSTIEVKNYEIHYLSVGIAVWLTILLLIKIFWL